MIRINENYTKLKASYLFSDIAKRVNAFVAANPSKPVIRLGIGDVTEPLPAVCLEALHAATDEMGLLLKQLGMDNAGTRLVKELTAPMPGMVVKVEVEAGSVVKKDQALVILEAMKMENVLKAQADGVVQNIEVKQGQAVEKNQVLIRFN